MKSILKKILVKVLGWQVRRLRKRNNFKIIGVVGSIGKTSTKLAIAKVLASEKRVRYQEGNYNEIISAPLIFFGQKMPQLWNVWQWLVIIIKNEWQIWRKFPFDVVVVELGTDAPGQIAEFRKYLHLDIAVITAIAPEHMEFFKNLQNVAEEEWSVRFFSDLIYANRDLCKVLPEDFNHSNVVFYGKNFDADYKYEVISSVQLYSISIAIILAEKFKIPNEKIKRAVSEIKSFSGRMQKLKGIKNSAIIDDTYNASPDAVKMALDALYAFESPQRIAILGMMNELGGVSEEEHRKVGKYCDAKLLDRVITVGKDANLFLAKEAEDRGCKVYRAKNAMDAGLFVKDKIKEEAVILAKGSQNGVFTEESLKPLLKNKTDFSKLVRQDKYWMKLKKEQGLITPHI
ncbi:MAG: Mur ligase family protein [Patescibacteria group bacterium]